MDARNAQISDLVTLVRDASRKAAALTKDLGEIKRRNVALNLGTNELSDHLASAELAGENFGLSAGKVNNARTEQEALLTTLETTATSRALYGVI